MVQELKDKEIEWLLETYTFDEILEQSNLTHREVLEFLLSQGWLSDLPEEMIPVN